MERVAVLPPDAGVTRVAPDGWLAVRIPAVVAIKAAVRIVGGPATMRVRALRGPCLAGVTGA